ncbi:hypothetical protein GGR50DRAFT_283282 [Xylaria sp. CBS 124048]|nr:hypothetical protein GGR50DRAFT_283282 [Xylaria sp. CBS 124048]
MDRRSTSPFALRIFYRTGAFHRPDEFAADSLPPHLTLYAWQDSTLDELVLQIAATHGRLLPHPAIGTRLAFRLIYQDMRGITSTSKYTIKEIGSVVIGDGGPGLDLDDPTANKTLDDTDPTKTLSDVRYVVGDYISCAILPPLPDGTVAPASSARMGRGMGVGESKIAVGRAPEVPPRDRDGLGLFSRHARGRGSMGRGGLDHFNTREPRGPGGGVPSGEWRRGEKLPDMPVSSRSRNRGGRF